MKPFASVDEVWLFGSSAREETDKGSDVDVLVVCGRSELPNSLIKRLKENYGDNVDVAHYSYSGLARLVDQRALFAWHLRREGVPLNRGAGRLKGMLQGMEPYDGHVRDLRVLEVVFDDAVASLREGLASRFDFGVVGTVIRNAGIIMHDLCGSWDFSPSAPVRLASIPAAPSLPIESSFYAYLCACRRASERGQGVEDRDVLALGDWEEPLAQVGQWLTSCLLCARKKDSPRWA